MESLQFPIVSENTAYKRYVSVKDRKVQFPDGRIIDWDVVGHGSPAPNFTVVFPFHSASKTVTMIREYAQGTNTFHISFPSGSVDWKKHTSAEHGARNELNEEARLEGGTWILLVDEKDEWLPELKWSTNRFIPYLVIDPLPSSSPLPQDDEELIEPIHNVTFEQFKQFLRNGQVMGPSAQTFLIAVERLKEMGLVTKEDL
ncbi:hypothetical protein BT69DRAFT_1358979 [Atractiella rhizophila]|nr:hypothetical protein BT69DRAFT_1358979 [Atractiella rhizophila]